MNRTPHPITSPTRGEGARRASEGDSQCAVAEPWRLHEPQGTAKLRRALELIGRGEYQGSSESRPTRLVHGPNAFAKAKGGCP